MTFQYEFWLGFLYADGFINSLTDKIGVSLSFQDRKHLEKFAQAIHFTGTIKDYVETKGYAEGSKYSRILFTSQEMKKDLITLGMNENKTYTLTFPKECQVPRIYAYDFIRGYFDGDGSLTYGHKQINGMTNYLIKITGTYEIVSGIQNIFGTKIKLEQRFSERNVNNYSLTIGGNQQVKRILDDMYKHPTIFLERKYNRYKQFTSSMVNATEGHR